MSHRDKIISLPVNVFVYCKFKCVTVYKVFVSQNDCTKVTHFSKWESRPVYFQSNVNIYHGSYKYEVYFYSCLHD